MREPFTQLYLHLVWATWDRLPLLTGELRRAVYSCIQAECVELQADVLAIGGIEDHVPVLVRIPTTVSVAQLVKQMKGASSHLVNHQLARGSVFKWQVGYGAFSVSKSHVSKARDYILRQAEHHRNQILDAASELPLQAFG